MTGVLAMDCVLHSVELTVQNSQCVNRSFQKK